MELKGKKVYFLGDSITRGSGASTEEKCYVRMFGKISGAEVKNYGVSGTRIAKQRVKSIEPMWDVDFISRVDKMEPDGDVIVVFGGTNDFGSGDAPIGNFDSRDEYAFYGAMHVLCEKLINKYPDAEIMFMTPLHRLGEEVFVNELINKETPLSGYVKIIKEVAGYYGLPVLDLFNTSGFQPKVDVIKEKYMPDGLHPSDAGAERIAKRLFLFLNTL